MRRAAAALLLLAALPVRAETKAALRRLVAEVTAEVLAVRGLRKERELDVQFLEDAAFLDAHRGHLRLEGERLRKTRAAWLAFGLAEPHDDPARIVPAVFDEQIGGFYDPATKKLVVRLRAGPAAREQRARALRETLAHEIQHALQDQNFGLGDLDKSAEDDSKLARIALIEGDATATAIAVQARHQGRGVSLSLGAAARALAGMHAEEIARASGFSRELLAAPAVVREGLLFPYLSGFLFVAELQKRGGFALVDRAFARPPTTTHQILHPEAYLAGERPAQVAPPEAPAGYRIVEQAHAGELVTRIALSMCVAPHVVQTYSDGWAGDAYTIAEGPGGELALLWRSAWTGSEAGAVADMLRSQVPCWKQLSPAANADGLRISARARVASAGTRVALVRGLPAEALEQATAGALDFSAVATPAEPPLGAAPPGSSNTGARASVERGVVSIPRLGLEGPLPPGFDADVKKPPAELVVTSRSDHVFATLSFVPQRLDEAGLQKFLDGAAGQIAAGVRASRAAQTSEHALAALGFAGTERSNALEGTPAQLRAFAAPVCGGRATVSLLRIHSDAQGRRALDQWLRKLRRKPGTLPACAELD